jgi:hypothetical protein
MKKIILLLFLLPLFLFSTGYKGHYLDTFAPEIQDDSCLVGEWLMYYESVYDRISGLVDPQKELVTIFQENGEYKSLDKKEVLSIGHWKLAGDSIILTYKSLIPTVSRQSTIVYRIEHLDCDTLKVNLRTHFGIGSREYKKLK